MSFVASLLTSRKPNIPQELVSRVEQSMKQAIASLFDNDPNFKWLAMNAANKQLLVYTLESRLNAYAEHLAARARFGHSIDLSSFGMRMHKFFITGDFEEYVEKEKAPMFFKKVHETLTPHLEPIQKLWVQLPSVAPPR
jgi:hypothetical protein